MSVQSTDSSNVALYDSVTMRPVQGLGVFASGDHAEDFLQWMKGLEAEGRIGSADPRSHPASWNVRCFARWQDERVDPETGELLEGVPV